MRSKGRLKGRKQKKGKNSPRDIHKRYECRWHKNVRLVTCSGCKWPWCPACGVKCHTCQKALFIHPILGKMSFNTPYWTEQQILDMDLPWYDPEDK